MSQAWEDFKTLLRNEPSRIMRDVLCIQASSVLRGDISGIAARFDKSVLSEVRDFYINVVGDRAGTAAAISAADEIDLIRCPWATPEREALILEQAAEDNNTSVRNIRLRNFFADKREREKNVLQKAEWWNKEK